MIRKFALLFGIVYVAVGILGFLPALAPHQAAGPHPTVETGHGHLVGLFPINVLRNLVHILVGVSGILGSRSLSGARLFARGLAVFYGVLAVLGLIPATNMLFGLVPIHGHDVWLHAASALVAAYFGFVAAPDPANAANTRPA